MPCQIKPQGAQTMTTPQHLLLCQYRYDPLDRLTGLNQPGTAVNQRFYCKSRLATQIQGAIGHAIFQHEDVLLAQQQHDNHGHDTTLWATDLQRSVLHTVNADRPRQSIVYSPYGHRPAESGLTSLLGFNGERPDPVTGHYLLGNGYRAFSPVLMRFNSPDSLSPFGKGGLNAYEYCKGDPLNHIDPTGNIPIIGPLLRPFFKGRLQRLRAKNLTAINNYNNQIYSNFLSFKEQASSPIQKSINHLTSTPPTLKALSIDALPKLPTETRQMIEYNLNIAIFEYDPKFKGLIKKFDSSDANEFVKKINDQNISTRQEKELKLHLYSNPNTEIFFHEKVKSEIPLSNLEKMLKIRQ
jgi:RHS repeat-associated protein